MIAEAVDIRSLFDRDPWEHQLKGVSETIERMQRVEEPIVLTSPTGGGKTAMMIALIRWADENRWPVVLYTNRNLLLEQTMGELDRAVIDYGVRAAEYRERLALLRDVQLCSIQTEMSQVYRKEARQLHVAKLAIFDEAHLMKTGGAERIINDHLLSGAKVVGVTATPLSLSHLYKHLIIAGRNSELRKCGALVPAYLYAPDELDCSQIKRTVTGEFNLAEVRKKVWTQAIIARVYDKWKHYNPDARPAIGFGPGVEESIWLAKQFHQRGIRAAHIDGNDLWVDGEYYKSDREARRQVVAEWAVGDIPICWNRFVLREGLDFPWLHHLILATPIGSLLSYIQTVGRVLRRSEETPDSVIVTDHGGNYWRHGSPNADQDWAATFNMPTRVVTDIRLEKMREKKDENPEPITCPKCGLVRRAGKQCPNPPLGCGFEHHKRLRMVLQRDGELKEVTGEILRPRRRAQWDNTQRLWDSMYFPSSRSKSRHASTFKQLEARFFLDHHYYPPRTLKNMPKRETDWYRKAKDVARGDLI